MVFLTELFLYMLTLESQRCLVLGEVFLFKVNQDSQVEVILLALKGVSLLTLKNCGT